MSLGSGSGADAALDRTREAAAAVERLQAALDEGMTGRNDAIRDAHTAGVRISLLVSVTGLTRARVNQIIKQGGRP